MAKSSADLQRISYKTPFFWANFPEEYKLANPIGAFKSKTKLLKLGTYT